MYSYTKVSPPASPQPSQTITLSAPSQNGTDSRKQQTRHTAAAKRQKYIRRIFRFHQMDFEYAFWQMLYLIIAPQKVYRNFAYRKQTKDQWARDDPAFLVLLSFWLCVSSIGFAVVLKIHFLAFIKFLFWVIIVDCIGVGILIATTLWFLTNRYMVVQPPRGQDVEWGYCFDVHLNAFFPLLMVLHFFQLPLMNAFIYGAGFFGRFVGNTFWLVAIGYYIYITFLGYSSLPFLKKTQAFLYPLTILFLIYLLSIIVGWNFSMWLCDFYKYRVW
ncbi:hypothetical protein LSH36_38g03043 [Paralvinella palmiformis]|uniref:Protein unc-50 homolog n=1 Tax=Paralvinella palmiformis TaxID=53620 RepID=A0AAD9K7J2_9ANNE|nr:hypothetical protein LSH36_38g03043 [Paralvinella palmiformis]